MALAALDAASYFLHLREQSLPITPSRNQSLPTQVSPDAIIQAVGGRILLARLNRRRRSPRHLYLGLVGIKESAGSNS